MRIEYTRYAIRYGKEFWDCRKFRFAPLSESTEVFESELSAEMALNSIGWKKAADVVRLNISATPQAISGSADNEVQETLGRMSELSKSISQLRHEYTELDRLIKVECIDILKQLGEDGFSLNPVRLNLWGLQAYVDDHEFGHTLDIPEIAKENMDEWYVLTQDSAHGLWGNYWFIKRSWLTNRSEVEEEILRREAEAEAEAIEKAAEEAAVETEERELYLRLKEKYG